jgi:hypothetical protein
LTGIEWSGELMRYGDMRVVVMFLLLTATASARPFADGLEIRFHDHSLFVRAKDGHEARLDPADGLTGFTYDAARQQVTVDYDTVACQIPANVTYSLARLKARLENAPAFALHRKKDYRRSLAGFQRAIAADPTWEIPAYNAASAQQLLGDQDGAIATLAPWLARAPVRTYVRIHQDPELAPLAARAEVKAVEAAKPGNVEVTYKGITGGAAYSATHELVAIVRQESSWGAPIFMREVEIYDAKGTLVTALPLVNFDETSPDCYETSCELAGKAAARKAEDRAARVQQLLRVLGFSRARTEGGDAAWDDGGTKRKVRFPAHELGLVERDGTIRIVRGNAEVATSPLASARLDSALLVEEVSAIIVWSHRPGAEGCEGTDPTTTQLVPVTL